MNKGDEMRKDDGPSAVRILPADGFEPVAPRPQTPKAPRRWFVPFLVFAGVLAAFLVATRPAEDDGDATVATIPPLLAAVSTEQIDVTNPAVIGNTADQWREGTLGEGGQVNDLIRSGRSYVAVGWTEGGGQAWISPNGTSWKPPTSLDLPESAKTSLNHAAPWQGDLVVLGSVDDHVGLWTADRLTEWEYQGTIESIGTNWISGLAAGAELLAISPANETLQGWMSSDGLEWRPLGPLPTLEAAGRIEALAATDEWYFAGGQDDCSLGTCSPVIFRSADGVSWEAVAGQLPDRLSPQVGVVMDIAVTPDGLVAIGSLGQRPNTQIAVWRSVDGANWERIGVADEAFSPVSLNVEVISTRPGDNPTATLAIDGTEHQVTVGSEILTDGGRLSVSAITESYIIIGADDSSRRRLAISTPTEITAWSTGWQVAVEGPRLVIAGAVVSDSSTSASIWTSGNSGITWSRTLVDEAGRASLYVATGGPNIVTVAASTTPQNLGVFQTTWDTTAIGEAATHALGSYLEALAGYETDHLIDLLPQINVSSSTPRFVVPSLGVARHEWWDPGTGVLMGDSVRATLDYLDATNMTLEYDSCTPSVSLGATDRVSVICDFQVDSDLLTTLGFAEGAGVIQAALAGDRLVSVAVNTSPSEQMWKTFSAGVIGRTEADRATVFAQNDSGAEVLAPTFNETTAATHLSLAEEFVAGLLRPGETRVIETALGSMEWAWIDPIDIPVFMLESVSWSELGFIATARGAPGQYTESLSVWMSADGVNWVETAAPSGIDSIWGLDPFADGVAGQGWTDGKPAVVYFNGADWTVLELPRNENGHQDLVYAGVREDRMLLIGGVWQEESGPSIDNAWILDENLALNEVGLPPLPEWTEINVGLAADDTGFILSATSFHDSRDLSIWHTTDGSNWTLIAESAAIEDASYLWNLQQHRSQYFVVGEGMEMRCTPDGAGEICESGVGVWSSPDGTAWDRVLTEAGAPVATYEIGSGDLGLVAFGQPTYGAQIPRPVYLSADGQTWHQAGGLSLLYPGVDWWWVNTPAVSGDTVVATGSGYQEGEDSEHPFLLVGRVLEGSS